MMRASFILFLFILWISCAPAIEAQNEPADQARKVQEEAHTRDMGKGLKITPQGIWIDGRQVTGSQGQTSSQETQSQPSTQQARMEALGSHISFADVIKKVGPSVVSIFTIKRSDPSEVFENPAARRYYSLPFNEPWIPRSRKHQGLGSGVIVSKEGYILTNNHVVENADEIKVALAKGLKDLPAKVIGTDPKTDIAVLKVEAKELQVATLGDSEAVEVGDVVLAIGSPFGLSQTVTMGIASAVGRSNIGILQDGYEDFIQTDASVNPGNSGGALIDTEGRVIGINTAIFSRTGGNQGIGFAVPINLARHVMDQIIQKGRVIRGFMGLSIQPINEELAEVMNLPSVDGALVSDVMIGGPAYKAGIREGDVITQVDGKPVDDPRLMRLMVGQLPPNSKLSLTILRNKKEQKLTVVLQEIPEKEAALDQQARVSVQKIFDMLEIMNLDAKTRQQLLLPVDIKGVVVRDVEQDSSAFDIGLRPGDVIIEIDRKLVSTTDQAIQISRSIKKKQILLRVWRNGARFVALPLIKSKE